MIANAVELIIFSPTDTTRRVVTSIACGLEAKWVRIVDLTLPTGSSPLRYTSLADLVIIGAPVYSGRLPAVMTSRLQQVRGLDTPAVLVVVDDNQACEDALIELRDVALAVGFRPIAAAAFIGEHSYATAARPIVAGRPDAADLQAACAFGATLQDKLAAIRQVTLPDPVQVPGNFPYKELRLFSGIAPTVQKTLCTRCAKCIGGCPMAAIPGNDPTCTNRDVCIRCCACVKFCPAKARTLDNPQIQQIAMHLPTNCRERKTPEIFGL